MGTLKFSSFGFVLISNFFGLTGILIGFILLIIYMASLKSMGVPFLAPFIPFRLHEMKDVFFRGDLRKLINSKHSYPHKE
ncbi:spore germination protein [Neobacillus sp. NRS-1170]|uniref:spore germination protein n=1 Tax=Neobacillus sp. NRS-1170 TaxID=3233898 RepID=UPI003D299FD1